MCERTIINKFNLRLNFILISVPIIFILSIFSYFFFELSGGENILLAIIFPINKSAFQQLKLCLYPTMFFWLLSYYFLYKRFNVDYTNWIFSMITSIVISIYFLLSMYYIFFSAFNITSLYLNILLLFIGITLGQLLGLHLYNHNLINDYYFSLDYILIIIVIFFTLFTFFPLKLPVFFDSYSNSYEFLSMLSPL